MRDSRILCVIPARYGSTRLPAKPLIEINGLPLVMWCYRRAVQASVFDRVCVATDDIRILEKVRECGGVAVMTSADHVRGTDRVYEVVRREDCTHVVNFQGDEPQMPIELLREFGRAVKNLDDNSLLTAVSHATIEEAANPSVVKVVTSVANEALYFSRSVIPFDRDGKNGNYLKHYGIYGFTAGGIGHFCQFPQGMLERRESLEQLRALENGMKIRCITMDFECHGIDTPEDLDKFRSQVGDTR